VPKSIQLRSRPRISLRPGVLEMNTRGRVISAQGWTPGPRRVLSLSLSLSLSFFVSRCEKRRARNAERRGERRPVTKVERRLPERAPSERRAPLDLKLRAPNCLCRFPSTAARRQRRRHRFLSCGIRGGVIEACTCRGQWLSGCCGSRCIVADAALSAAISAR